MKRKLFFAFVLAATFLGVRMIFSSPPQQIGVKNLKTHKKNQKLFAEIIQAYSNEEYFTHISQIGEQALNKKKIDLSSYQYERYPKTKELCFVAVPLWEGKNQADVTYFLYIWPSKKEALKYNQNDYYATNVHSHPIPCALTVLQGAITEIIFAQTEEGCIKKKDEKILHEGEMAIDLKKSPFIHQIVNEGDRRAITLHAYGKKTVKEVRENFAILRRI
ncbi:MAG: hypothetical protein KDK55_06715 [Chlamydiia bacterium]|nr:hypothetical protein [Chlamydiia bacterium]